ncbi:metallophosphoesterase family protein [Ferrimonas gelatinilytica]
MCRRLLLLCLLFAAPLFASELMVSSQPDRSNAVPLQNQILEGQRFIFYPDEAGLQQVRFFLNGTFEKEENRAPWDLGGTDSDSARSALAFDTGDLAEGSQELEARLRFDDGSTSSVFATFQVQSDTTPILLADPGAIDVALMPEQTTTTSLQLSTSDGQATPLILTENSPWLSLSSYSGVSPLTLEAGLDGRGLEPGTYSSNIAVNADGYPPLTLPVTLRIGDVSGDDAPQLHLAWDRGADGLTVVWFSPDPATPTQLQLRAAGQSQWLNLQGQPRHSNDDGIYHQVGADNLTASTRYEFRLLLAPQRWSRIYTTLSPPEPGSAWEAAFVADTGLIGREDGLATGTAAVIGALANQPPDLLLLGGDYAYYDTDKRYGTLERTIDAWFNQMAPLAEVAMMPAWGNHEIRLGEGFAPWAARFPLPAGYDEGRMYAFDVGDVHFISVYAFHEKESMPQSAVDWLSDHLDAIAGREYRWVIPFMHVAPFSDGTNHPSAHLIRAQLGPLFEKHGIRLVLTAHDQNYERTWPLVDVPESNQPTSERLDCYGPADGTIYMKISPGGKRSNINGDFSQWRTVPAPSWTAFRNNDAHHFARLAFTAAGELNVKVYGIDGDQPLRQIDSFSLRAGCGGAISAVPASLSFNLAPGESATQTLQLSLTEGSGDLRVDTDQPWLRVAPAQGPSPLVTDVEVDTQGMAPGNYQGQLRVESSEELSRTLGVNLSLFDDQYRVLIADNPERASPILMEDARVSGEIFAFIDPPTGLDQVNFLIDGVQQQQENRAPWDLGGTAGDGSAQPFDTAFLSDGLHTLTARLILADGGEMEQILGFTVANEIRDGAPVFTPAQLQIPLTLPEVSAELNVSVSASPSSTVTLETPTPWLSVAPGSGQTPLAATVTVDASGLTSGNYQGLVRASNAVGSDELPVTLVLTEAGSATPLWWSTRADRSAPIALEGSSVEGIGYVFVADDGLIRRVRFYIDGIEVQTENNAPWDLGGTANDSNRNALPFDFATLGAGSHWVEARIERPAGEERTGATFTVTP